MMKAKGIHSSKVIGLRLDGPFQPVFSIFPSFIHSGNILSSSHPGNYVTSYFSAHSLIRNGVLVWCLLSPFY